jgi:hypothetical protein
VPYRWLLAVAVAGTFIGAGAPVASAAQSPPSVAAFRKAAKTLQKEPVPFSIMLQQSSAPSLSRLESVCKAELPLIKNLRHGRWKDRLHEKDKGRYQSVHPARS